MANGVRSSLRKYLKETRRPIYSAALVLPFFLIYHVGSLFLGSTYINGADALIIRLLSALSVHSMFASALVLLACFVIWQLRTRASWDISSRRLITLFGEGLLFAVLLFFIFAHFPVLQSRALASAGTPGGLEKLVLYCGAGIYEELVFRGFLLGLLMLVSTRLMHMNKTPAAVCSSLVAALLFSLFHYVGQAGDRFAWGTFLQRTWGGLYFSALFVTRGFGVTAAAHAFYDMLVGMLTP
ncbi:MAG: CPBP family intramembrane metalloprotease [Acidobacteriia bacterium]|nr:CPBP family intramembrane metalloprotease [Terriglobia bacterium]